MRVVIGIVAIAVGFLLFAPCARASELVPEKADWDFTLKFGTTVGTVSKTDPTTKEVTTFDYGGIPFAIQYNSDLTRGLTLLAEIHLVADPSNIQVTRTGFDFGVAMHLLGGSRRLIEEFGALGIVRREPYNVSLLGRFGLHRYVASAGSNALSGSLFDAMVGLQARFDIDDISSISVDVYRTAFTLAASLDGLAASQTLFFFGWRFFL